jgi:hypothetical protein
MCSEELARVDEPANQTYWDLVGWLPNPMFFLRKAFVLDLEQVCFLDLRLSSYEVFS